MSEVLRGEEPSLYAEVVGRVLAFSRAREWAAFHNPKNLAMAISSEAGERPAFSSGSPPKRQTGLRAIPRSLRT